jgi:hypothetical protein
MIADQVTGVCRLLSMYHQGLSTKVYEDKIFAPNTIQGVKNTLWYF